MTSGRQNKILAEKQKSMPHEKTMQHPDLFMVRPAEIEPATKNLEGFFKSLPTLLYKINIILR